MGKPDSQKRQEEKTKIKTKRTEVRICDDSREFFTTVSQSPILCFIIKQLDLHHHPLINLCHESCSTNMTLTAKSPRCSAQSSEISGFCLQDTADFGIDCLFRDEVDFEMLCDLVRQCLEFCGTYQITQKYKRGFKKKGKRKQNRKQ